MRINVTKRLRKIYCLMLCSKINVFKAIWCFKSHSIASSQNTFWAISYFMLCYQGTQKSIPCWRSSMLKSKWLKEGQIESYNPPPNSTVKAIYSTRVAITASVLSLLGPNCCLSHWLQHWLLTHNIATPQICTTGNVRKAHSQQLWLKLVLQRIQQNLLILRLRY